MTSLRPSPALSPAVRTALALVAIAALSACEPNDRNAYMMQHVADRCRGQFSIARSAAESTAVIQDSYGRHCAEVVGADLRARAKAVQP